jgi:hypothetical protein
VALGVEKYLALFYTILKIRSTQDWVVSLIFGDSLASLHEKSSHIVNFLLHLALRFK